MRLLLHQENDMGQTHGFICPNCEYLAEVAGGRTFGFYAVVETIVCRDCKKLYDATANEKAPDIPGDILAFDGLTGIHCPKSKKHSFTAWTDPWLCPKCDTPMDKGGLFVCWD
jgi:hypothetical protein